MGEIALNYRVLDQAKLNSYSLTNSLKVAELGIIF